MLRFEMKRWPKLQGEGFEYHFIPVKKQESDEEIDAGVDPFSIIADERGIRFKGQSPVVYNRLLLDDFALAVAQAWQQHLKLKPRVERVGPQMELPLEAQ